MNELGCTGRNEHHITSIIYEQQQLGKCLDLLRILYYNEEYYDAELLDVHARDMGSKRTEIESNIKTLHDLRPLSVGWILEPPFYYSYKRAFKLHFGDTEGVFQVAKNNREILPLTSLDDILWDTVRW